MKLHYLRNVVTLELNRGKCTGCGMCLTVCPRDVLTKKAGNVVIIDRDACIECGACQMNCPFEAISVKSGVGCAYAVLYGKLKGTEPQCGCSEGCC